ncbi:MAG: MATE family efflux transporter [Lachnospiraceae bacterium]|nr:MATE family efflux transporter [Lachnospiraceae bacterium]
MKSGDFTQGSILSNIMSMALPITLGQLINILYSVVDRIYIGRIPGTASLALTGLGLSVPVTTIVMAFANLYGMGGGPLCSIERGKKNDTEAQAIMCNSFVLLTVTGVLLTLIIFRLKRPMLYLFGASDETFPYANDYLTIYLLGTVFVMISLGMNHFINAQGFGKTGMITIMSGAVSNIILDPVFIFGFDMGIRGAAIATVISQFISAAWVLYFLTGKKALFTLQHSAMKLKAERVGRICALGLSGFIVGVTNSAVSVVCNATLQACGSDLYVGVMTVINTVREVISMPVTGISSGAQPVIGYNYGAGAWKRVRGCIKVLSILGIGYTAAAWIMVSLFARPLMSLFTSDTNLIEAGIPCFHIYYAAFVMMSLQFTGQSVFQALGRSKQAIFFSLLRKVIIVIPLTILLPKVMTPGVYGVFAAEPISNVLGGIACYATMLSIMLPELKRLENSKKLNIPPQSSKHQS